MLPLINFTELFYYDSESGRTLYKELVINTLNKFYLAFPFYIKGHKAAK